MRDFSTWCIVQRWVVKKSIGRCVSSVADTSVVLCVCVKVTATGCSFPRITARKRRPSLSRIPRNWRARSCAASGKRKSAALYLATLWSDNLSVVTRARPHSFKFKFPRRPSIGERLGANDAQCKDHESVYFSGRPAGQKPPLRFTRR